MVGVDELLAAHKARAERSLKLWQSHLDGSQEQMMLNEALKA
jgi:hypothetical protein